MAYGNTAKRQDLSICFTQVDKDSVQKPARISLTAMLWARFDVWDCDHAIGTFEVIGEAQHFTIAMKFKTPRNLVFDK